MDTQPAGAGGAWQKEMECGKPFLRVYALLIRAAEERRLVTYGDVATIMGIGQRGGHMALMTGRMLGTIVERERSCGRPML